jgi:hypothetical protein
LALRCSKIYKKLRLDENRKILIFLISRGIDMVYTNTAKLGKKKHQEESRYAIDKLKIRQRIDVADQRLSDVAIDSILRAGKHLDGEESRPIKKKRLPSRVLISREQKTEIMLNSLKERLDYNTIRVDVNIDKQKGEYIHFSRNKDPYDALNIFDLLSTDEIGTKLLRLFKRPLGVIALSQDNIYRNRVWSYIATKHDVDDMEIDSQQISYILKDDERRKALVADSISKLSWLHSSMGILAGDVGGQNMIVNSKYGFMFKSAGQMEALEDGKHANSVSEMLMFICSLEKNGVIEVFWIPSIIKYYLEIDRKNYVNAREYLKSIGIKQDELDNDEIIVKQLSNRTMYIRMIYYSN